MLECADHTGQGDLQQHDLCQLIGGTALMKSRRDARAMPLLDKNTSIKGHRGNAFVFSPLPDAL